MRKDSTQKTLIVAGVVCLVCSIFVSSTAVTLRPEQLRNQELERKRNILDAAGLLEEGSDIEAMFADRVIGRIIDLESGSVSEEPIEASYDPRKEAADPAKSKALSTSEDIAGIRRRAERAAIYLVNDESGAVSKLILPVHGQGLWSTMYGFVALDAKAQIIEGLTFYEHGETPGLGGEIDNPRWRRLWRGKVAFDDTGNVVIEVIKGTVDTSRPDAKHKVDGISGATITARGVSNMMKYWLSDNAYGPFLKQFREQGQDNG